MLTLTATQRVGVAITPVDAKGNVARIDGPATFLSSDETILTVTPNGDLAALVTATGKLGTAQLSVAADGDLGEGVRPLRGTLDIEIVAGEAVALTINANAPEEQ